MINAFSISSIVIIISNFIFATFLFFKGGKGKILRLWGFICLSAALWGIAGYKFSTTTSNEIAFSWWQIGYIAGIWTPILFYYFIVTFLGLHKKKYQIHFFIAVVIGIVLTGYDLFAPHLFLGDIKFSFEQFYYLDWWARKPFLYLVYYFYLYHFLLLYAFYLIVKAYKIEQGIKKEQLKYFILGAAIWWLGPHGDYLPAFGVNIYPYSNFCIAIAPIIFTYAILKHRLMDIRVVISRMVVFLFIYAPILLIPFVIVFTKHQYFVSVFGIHYWIIPTVLELVFALAGLLLYRYIERKTARTILREEYQHEQAIKNIAKDIIGVKDKKILSEKLTNELKHAVGVSSVAMYLLDSKKEKYDIFCNLAKDVIFPKQYDFENKMVELLKKNQDVINYYDMLGLDDNTQNSLKQICAELIVPIVESEELLGFIVLGEKNNKRLFSKMELMALKVLGYQVAIVFLNIMFLEKMKKEIILRESVKAENLGNLIAGLSHNLKTPIMSSAGSVSIVNELLDRKDLKNQKSDIKSWMDDIQENLVYMDNMIKGVQKQIVNTDEVVVEEISISEVISRIESLMYHELEKRKCSLVVKNNLDPDCVIKINLNDFLQVMNVIISNAIDSYQGKGGKINLFLEHNNDTLTVKVEDFGKGIPENIQKSIFKKMVTTKGTDGAGLGLYLAYSVVKGRLNGDMWFKSTEGKGSEFILLINNSATI